MRLIDLQPQFLRNDPDDLYTHHYVQSKDEANGIEFLCPVCFEKNGGAIGTHAVICWDPTVAQDVHPVPGRWEMRGTGFEDLTLFASPTSVQLVGGCNAHFLVQNGQILSA